VELEPEVSQWMQRLPTAEFMTVAFYVDLLAEHGPLLGEPYTRQLDGKLRELRLHLARQAVRITYSDRAGSADRVVDRVHQDPDAGDPADSASAQGLGPLHRRGPRHGGLRMTRRTDWTELRNRRMTEPGAAQAYEAARRAYELGRTVRELREQREWSQSALAQAAGMTQSAVARFEAGGTVPSLPVLERLAEALDADLTVQVTPRPHVA
jgi:DNA-binding XRE family transcriptional regulator